MAKLDDQRRVQVDLVDVRARTFVSCVPPTLLALHEQRPALCLEPEEGHVLVAADRAGLGRLAAEIKVVLLGEGQDVKPLTAKELVARPFGCVAVLWGTSTDDDISLSLSARVESDETIRGRVRLSQASSNLALL